jgi:hypothetical protein
MEIRRQSFSGAGATEAKYNNSPVSEQFSLSLVFRVPVRAAPTILAHALANTKPRGQAGCISRWKRFPNRSVHGARRESISGKKKEKSASSIFHLCVHGDLCGSFLPRNEIRSVSPPEQGHIHMSPYSAKKVYSRSNAAFRSRFGHAECGQ